jgi:hypothetical protein
VDCFTGTVTGCGARGNLLLADYERLQTAFGYDKTEVAPREEFAEGKQAGEDEGFEEPGSAGGHFD